MRSDRQAIPPSDAGVLAVLVLYEKPVEKAEAWASLMLALRTQGPSAFRLRHVLVYDNSAAPQGHNAESLPQCTYIHDPANGGTAAAYKRGTTLARSLGLCWLLLLDHDTAIPADFLAHAGKALSASTTQSPVALLPWVQHGQRMISPARLTIAGTIRPLERGQPIQPSWRITAIASGSILRVAALGHIDSMPTALWLDYVDHWIFAGLPKEDAAMAIVDCVLQHDLSVESPALLSTPRLQNILMAESLFVACLPWPARIVHPWRLVSRAALMYRRHRDHAWTILKHALDATATFKNRNDA